MTCKDFSGMIPAFFEDQLENAPLREFLEHYHDCENCREELEIQYLVKMAFEQMESGEEINLAKDLPEFIERSRYRLDRRVRLGRTAAGMEIAAAVLFVITAAVYLWL